MNGTELLKAVQQERYSVGDQKEGHYAGDDCRENRYKHLQQDVLEGVEESHVWHVGKPLGYPGVVRCCESDETDDCLIGEPSG